MTVRWPEPPTSLPTSIDGWRRLEQRASTLIEQARSGRVRRRSPRWQAYRRAWRALRDQARERERQHSREVAARLHARRTTPRDVAVHVLAMGACALAVPAVVVALPAVALLAAAAMVSREGER